VLPTGGAVVQSTATTATISNIDLGNGIASEEWDFSVTGGALSWAVRRTFHASGFAQSDQAPALWRRLASRAGRVFDQPAPNPLYRVNVDRCVKAAHPLAQH
jgi:hypothetical protein